MGGLSKREKTLLYILLVCVVVFLYYNFIFTRQMDRLGSLKTTIEDNREKLEILKIQEESIDKLKEDVDELTAKEKEIEKVIPETSNIPEIITIISEITSSSGCTGGALNFGEAASVKASSLANYKNGQQNNEPEVEQGQIDTVTSGIVMVIPMTYQVKGSYNSIMAFLSGIEESTRRIVVEKVTFSKNAGPAVNSETVTEANGNMLTASLSISALFRRNGEPEEPVNYPLDDINIGKSNMFD